VTGKSDNPILSMISRMISPFIMIYALYVIFHGHYSPGGGFQGGTMLGAAVILSRLASGSELSRLLLGKGIGTLMGAIGVFIYFGTGFLAMLLGGRFLEYKYLARIMPVSDAMARNWGIQFVEVGVGLAVMGIMVALYDDILTGEPDA